LGTWALNIGEATTLLLEFDLDAEGNTTGTGAEGSWPDLPPDAFAVSGNISRDVVMETINGPQNLAIENRTPIDDTWAIIHGSWTNPAAGIHFDGIERIGVPPSGQITWSMMFLPYVAMFDFSIDPAGQIHGLTVWSTPGNVEHIGGHIETATSLFTIDRIDAGHQWFVRGERGLMAAYRRAHKIWEPSLS
jgi:hypothetical protein